MALPKDAERYVQSWQEELRQLIRDLCRNKVTSSTAYAVPLPQKGKVNKPHPPRKARSPFPERGR